MSDHGFNFSVTAKDKKEKVCLNCGIKFISSKYHHVQTGEYRHRSFCNSKCRYEYQDRDYYGPLKSGAGDGYRMLAHGMSTRDVHHQIGISRVKMKKLLEFHGYDYDLALKLGREKRALDVRYLNGLKDKTKKRNEFWRRENSEARKLAAEWIRYRRKYGKFHGFRSAHITEKNYTREYNKMYSFSKRLKTWHKFDNIRRGWGSKYNRGGKSKSSLFENEHAFCDHVADVLMDTGFRITKEFTPGGMSSGRRCDLLAERGLFSYSIECKNNSRTNQIDCAIGQVLCMNHFMGYTPVVCLPSDTPVDNDSAVICKRYGIILCNEKTITSLLV